ncbi:MAG TPA: hypothetical protein PKA63_04100 [Oligoflexia bacterium]|nr:hypothetical protein [Oligoflexia bacterium]HMP47832.1 hypothetical protein [Oligoflexia bacterium]
MSKQSNEIGSINSVCLFFSILTILGLQNYWHIIQEQLIVPYQLTLLALTATFVLFSILSGLYSVFSGEKSTGQLRREIIKESRKLDKLAEEARSALLTLEGKLRTMSGIMHPQGFRELRKLKAMLSCLEGRCRLARESLISRDREEVEHIYNTFFSDLGETEDVVNHLVLDDFLETCPYKKIPNELHKTLKNFEESLPRRRHNTIH